MRDANLAQSQSPCWRQFQAFGSPESGWLHHIWTPNWVGRNLWREWLIIAIDMHVLYTEIRTALVRYSLTFARDLNGLWSGTQSYHSNLFNPSWGGEHSFWVQIPVQIHRETYINHAPTQQKIPRHIRTLTGWWTFHCHKWISYEYTFHFCTGKSYNRPCRIPLQHGPGWKETKELAMRLMEEVAEFCALTCLSRATTRVNGSW